jgi:PAS domain S-box-containing protein
MSTRNISSPNDGLVGDDLFRLMVECVTDYAIFMLDPSGRVATWNNGAQSLKGYRADEILGKHFSIFYPVEDVAGGKPSYELEEASRVGRFEDEGWRIRKDGTRFWANVIITSLRDHDGVLRGYGKVTRDLTARKTSEEVERELAARRAAEAERARAAEEQRRTIAELLRAEEDARRIGDLQERFVAIVGHDLRTPLSVISLGASTIAQRGGLAPEQQVTLDRITRSAQRMREIIHELLDVVRARQGLGIPVVRGQADLAEIARRAVAELGELSSERPLAIEVRGDTSLEGDPARLLQVVSNLVGNAVQHGSGPVRIEIAGTADEVTLSVHNDGSPIAPDMMSTLFEPFRRGPARDAGRSGSLGLGLFIVREVVRAHGGEVEVESGEDGTNFTVRLPRCLLVGERAGGAVP